MVSFNAPIASSVLIGRESELNALTKTLYAAQQGQGHCSLIAGEVGIGKSRLVAELLTRAAAKQFLIVQGRCFEQDISFPYASWIDGLRSFLAPKSVAEVGELLGAYASELVKLVPELSLALPSIRPTPLLEPEAEKHRLFESLARFLASLATVNPLLIVLEDIHWSDEQSLDLLHFFARRIIALPILIVATYRTDELSPRISQHLGELNRERGVDEIRLAPLTRQDVEQMVRAIFKSGQSNTAQWLDVLMPLTGGNPFFIEEILKSIQESGALSAPDSIHIPRSIQQLVQHRAAQLSEDTQQVLSQAAVLGERFDFGLLRQVAAQDEASLLRILKELIAAQFLVEQSAEQFAFRHALIRETIYARLLRRERQALHRRIAETMERFWTVTRESHAAELAYHFYQGAVWDQALNYSQRAGEQAHKLFAPREALTHFSRALEAAEMLGSTPASSLLLGRAHALDSLGEFERARADYETALDIVRRASDPRGEWATLIDLGFLWQSRDWVRAGEFFERAFELARSLEDTALVGHSLNRIGNWYMNRRHPREALPYHQQALEMFQAVNDRRGTAQTLDLLGVASGFVGDVIQGAAYSEQAVALFRELDDRQSLVRTLSTLCLRPRFDVEVLGEMNLHQLVTLGETTLEMARSFNWRQGEAGALTMVALCLCRTGEYGRGSELFRRAIEISEEIQHRFFLSAAHRALGAEVYLPLLAPAQARDQLETALRIAQDLRSELFTMAVASRLASACIVQKDWTRAEALLDPVLTTDLPAAEIDTLLRDFWTACAELELARGSPGRALEIVDRLLASTMNLAEYGPHAVPRLSQLRGQALVALGRMPEAAEEFQGTQTVAQKQGYSAILWHLHIDLGNAYRGLGRREAAADEFALARSWIEQIANTVPDDALRENFLKQAIAMIPTASSLTPRQATKKQFGGLTARERQVAALVAEGKSNREIADTLVITVRAVEANITRILDKLGFQSRAQIAVWAVAKGLARPLT